MWRNIADRWRALLSLPHLKERDPGIGWTEEQGRQRLGWIANNSRDLILEDALYPNLASRVMLTTHEPMGYAMPMLYSTTNSATVLIRLSLPLNSPPGSGQNTPLSLSYNGRPPLPLPPPPLRSHS